MTRDALVISLIVVGVLLLGWVLWPRRGPSVHLRAVNRISRLVLAGPVATWGIGLIVASVVWRVPKGSELIKHTEHLLSFYVLHQSNSPWFPGRSKTWYDIVWYTSEGGRYFSDSLNESVAIDALQHPGTALQFYIKPSQRAYTLENGEHAVPTYGLSVDGREIQSRNAALDSERRMVRFGFPVLGLALVRSPTEYRDDARRHLTNRWNQPRAVMLSSFMLISFLRFDCYRAPARGGSALSR